MRSRWYHRCLEICIYHCKDLSWFWISKEEYNNSGAKNLSIVIKKWTSSLQHVILNHEITLGYRQFCFDLSPKFVHQWPVNEKIQSEKLINTRRLMASSLCGVNWRLLEVTELVLCLVSGTCTLTVLEAIKWML